MKWAMLCKGSLKKMFKLGKSSQPLRTQTPPPYELENNNQFHFILILFFYAKHRLCPEGNKLQIQQKGHIYF